MEFCIDGIEAADVGSLLEQFEEASAGGYDVCEVALASENTETTVPLNPQNDLHVLQQGQLPLGLSTCSTDREIAKSLQGVKNSSVSSPAGTPPGTPPPEMIQKIKGSSTRKAAIMLPMGLHSKSTKARGESPAKFTSRRLEKIMKEQSRLETEAYFNFISDHGYCENFKVSDSRASLYVYQDEEDETDKQNQKVIKTKPVGEKDPGRPSIALKDFLNNEEFKKLTQFPKSVAVAKVVKKKPSAKTLESAIGCIPNAISQSQSQKQPEPEISHTSVSTCKNHSQVTVTANVEPEMVALNQGSSQKSDIAETEKTQLTEVTDNSPKGKQSMKRSDSSSSLSSSCSRESRKLYIKKKKHRRDNKVNKQPQGSWPKLVDSENIDLSAGLPELPLFDTKSKENTSVNSSRNSSRSSTPSIDFEVQERADRMGPVTPVKAQHGKAQKNTDPSPVFGPMVPNGTRSRSSTPIPTPASVQSEANTETAKKENSVECRKEERADDGEPRERFSRFVSERKLAEQKETAGAQEDKSCKSVVSSRLRGQGNRRGRGITATSVKERRCYRKRAPSPEETLYDKLPNYVTVLSQPSKNLKKSESAKNLVNDSLPERDPSPDRSDPMFDKIPAYYSCFTNSTKYDHQNPLAIEQVMSNQSSRSTTPHLVIETRGNSRATSPDKGSSGHRSRSSSSSYRSVSSRSSDNSRSPSRSPSRFRSARHHERLSRRSRKRHHSVSSRSSSRSHSRSRSRSSMSRSRSRSHSYSRSRSRSSSTGRSRHKRRRYDRSRSRSESLESCRRRHRELMAQYREEEKKQRMKDRRIVYVGGIPDGFTKKDLRNIFQGFGEIEETSVHFREHGDNYGFVTFAYRCDAFAAIESHKEDPYLKDYDLCFGGRREFCTTDYADLDGDLELEEELNPAPSNNDSNLDFEELLHQTKRMLKKKS